MRDSAGQRLRRWVTYRAVSAAIHQPGSLRRLAALVQRYAWIGRALKVVASRDDVVAVFRRQAAFSCTAHRPNLVAGDFAIGMAAGPRHGDDRRLLHDQLPSSVDFADRAAEEGRRRVTALLAGPVRRFDLIEDYMVPVVWNAMGGAFGGSLPPLQPGDPLFGHLRYIGAHLIVGAAATESVQRRARESGAALNAWVRARLEPLQLAWRRPGVDQREHVARNAVGMLWVGHPATVQGGALVMQELLARRAVLRQLVLNIEWARGGRLSNPELREVVKNHVLELLRFRPPFPILRRDVVRDTLYGTDGAGRAGGGSQLTLLILGALFDPAAQLNASCKPSEYRPGRAFREADDRYLIFGVGARQCIARDQVIETLVSALICLLELPNLRWADPWWRRMRYDGPIVSSMRLAFDSR